MALKRTLVVLVLLLLAEWTSGLAAAACTVVAADHQPRMTREVYPIAVRYSRQLHKQVGLPPLLPTQAVHAVPAPTPAAWPHEQQAHSPPADRLLFTLLSLRW
ncbi:MAG TPA: hypothetical protein VJ739_03020 [Gemmataceae bacterium]|nr:hypothetical protein [Gemmataceae bacterium]